MLRTDKIMLENILHLTKEMNADIAISENADQLLLMENISTVKGFWVIKGVKPVFVEPSIMRLIDKGFLKYSHEYSGGFQFCLTDLAFLRNEIFWDDFKKRFFYGFASGVFTTVFAELLILSLRALTGI